MTATRLLAVAALSGFIALPAFAQSPAPADPAETPPPADQAMPDPQPAPPPPAAAPMSPGALAATHQGADASAVTPETTVRVVTNGPVPDTKENRAKYGQPDSNAGKRSKPAGN